MCTATVAANEVQYIIRSSQSQSCADQCSKSDCASNELTLSQFVNSTSSYLTNNTRLIFSPGNYSLESELVAENVHSFSMSAWPMRATIICGKNSRFEFRNISTVSVSGLEFIGCFENHVVSIDLFQLQNSQFFGNGQVLVNGTVLTIEDSTASLDGVAFISAVEKLQTSSTPQNLPEDCIVDEVVGILLKNSGIRISHCKFEGNKVGLGAVIFGSDIIIFNTTFINNSATWYCTDYCCFAGGIVYVSKSQGSNVQVYHSKFQYNIGVAICMYSHGDKNNVYTSTASIIHSEFINNTVTGPRKICNGVLLGSSLIFLDAVMKTISDTKFFNNRATFAIVYVPYYHYTAAENFIKNLFNDNSAGFEVFIGSTCQPGHILPLSSTRTRCIPCSKNRLQDLIGLVLAAFIAGIALVIITLALNMTVAIGTLNGILFYAHIVAANVDTYFLPFKTPNFVTVFISWLNLDIGFDVCFTISAQSEVGHVYQALVRLAFPVYVTFLVIVVIVAGEYSPKFAKIIGKGNPVAVLATMILLSSAKFLNVVLASFTLLYWKPAFGSRNVDVTALGSVTTLIEEVNTSAKFKTVSYLLFILGIIILPLYVVFSALVFSWQWLSQYQGSNMLFKWVKYQKLHHFLEPYHAPYNGKYRYWTGLLLFVRIFLHVIALLNFSLDPRVNLVSMIFFVGGLILLKGIIAKRVYKNLLIDVMETAVYFNLVAFSALTLYTLEVERSQAAVTYTSVTSIFILLLGVITFHVLRYTRLYECSLVEKSFKWISSKLEDKNSRNESRNNAPEVLDGYQMERSVAGDQELPTTTFSVVEISQVESAQNT